MALPPGWKVKRELERARDQIARGLERLYAPAVDRHHLRRLQSRLSSTDGSAPKSSRIAIFVLYQPGSVARSTYLTCRHLVANGYAPLIVSNAPLQRDDHAALSEQAWVVVERPNHGYDFGAYRDCLRLVAAWGLDPDAVVLMNDSTWFPLWLSDRTLARLDLRDAPFSGLSFKHEPRIRRGRPHMESHFLRFSREAMAAPAFARFWSDYTPSSSRVTTIERGEKGITAAMEDAGFTPEAALSREIVLTRLATAPAEDLRRTLAEADLLVEADRGRCSTLLARYAPDEAWSAEARVLLAELTDTFTNILSGPFLSAAIRLELLSFLKKSRERRFQTARERFLRLVESGEIPCPDPTVLQEIRLAAAGSDGKANPR